MSNISIQSFSILAVIILTSFVSLAIFGFITMMAHGNHADCAAAAAQGMACPASGLFLAYLAFHFDALKLFSTAILGSSFVISLLLMLAALVIAVGFVLIRPPLISSRTFESFDDFLRSPFLARLTTWTALHEASPFFG